MNKLDINGFYLVTSFLKSREINKLGVVSKHFRYNCRNFMTYVYNEYGRNESYYRLHMAKWIVYKCSVLMFRECVSKNLTLVSVEFDNDFNKTIEALTHCTNLQQITFGRKFNQSIGALTNYVNLKQITVDWRSINPSKPSPAVQTFNK